MVVSRVSYKEEIVKMLMNDVEQFNGWRRRSNVMKLDLAGACLSFANIAGADLSEVELGGADLSYADLSRVNFSKANLKKANFRGANLSEANFTEACLYQADFSGCIFKGNSFHEANLWNAKGVPSEIISRYIEEFQSSLRSE